jgi:hypothetical protein
VLIIVLLQFRKTKNLQPWREFEPSVFFPGGGLDNHFANAVLNFLSGDVTFEKNGFGLLFVHFLFQFSVEQFLS